MGSPSHKQIQGPLKPSTTGCHLILVFIVYATWYPEVVAICNAPSQTVLLKCFTIELVNIPTCVSPTGNTFRLGHGLDVVAIIRSMNSVKSPPGQDLYLLPPDKWSVGEM